ncbi:hypothetical protein M5D96_003959 [Drosophila gunungcola]|uniref:C-type lectin domain-containing protein n=1 Tax=Drosophila gunungcola TaxID=103775 RepID=A0A9P9YTL5_9MUSC|nr:hypothetical protein M5D96_003959 [Drosophila gunungcola]
MFKLGIVLIYILIAGSLNDSMSHANKFDYSETNQDRWNTCRDVIANDTLAGQVFSEKLVRMEAHLTALESKLETIFIQLTAIQERLSMPPGFIRIGSRYFHIEENITQNWYTAALTCRQKGGHLATIRNQEELALISEKLETETYYWLGIFEPLKRGEFATVVSNKTAPFLKWHPLEPIYVDNALHCVLVRNSVMHVENCKTPSYRFICQADDKN